MTVNQSRNPASAPLPSLGKHIGLAAVTVFAVGGGLTALLLGGSPSQAFASGEIIVPARELPPASDSLMADMGGDALPDLLAGDVADGENPTEALLPVTPPPPPSGAKIIQMDSAPQAALAVAPIDGLQTRSSFGMVPKVGEDGRTAFKAYARPFTSSGKPTVSIVVSGLGINAEMTQRAIDELPPSVTLAFAAHSPNLQADIDMARADGHEIILELPMEGATSNPEEPGADRMLAADRPTEALRNLDYLLSRGAGYFAVMPYNGDIFLARSEAASPVLSRLADAGLGLITDSQLSVSGLGGLASGSKLPFRNGTMLIDADPDPDLIARDLEALRAKALAGEAPIGFGFAYPQTIDAVRDFIGTLERAELAPASAAIQK